MRETGGKHAVHHNLVFRWRALALVGKALALVETGISTSMFTDEMDGSFEVLKKKKKKKK